MRGIFRRAAGAGLLFLAAALGANGCASDSAESCIEGARTYEDGAQWTCSDGCNRCGCDNGVLLSTAIGCTGPPGPAAGMLMCEEGDFWHTHGEVWVCADSCDECGCEDGRLLRTTRQCTDGGDAG